MYSHDSYGLGHLRRTLALAETFVRRNPKSDVIIVTGSTLSNAYRLPKGVDVVKLPSAVKTGAGVYEAGRLSVDFSRVRKIRSNIIKGTLEAFDPDVFIVDKAPIGMKGEVEETLRFVKEHRPETLTVLGLRDVMDDPGLVRKSWREGRIPEAVRELYDIVFVYGPREVYDPLPEYGLDDETLAKTHYVGYVGKRRNLKSVEELPFTPGYALVTVGGGGDGLRIIESYLKGLALYRPEYGSVVVTGPMMSDKDRNRVEGLAKGLPVRVLEFRADMDAVIQGARAVVTMGGYNTTTELLEAGKPAVIVPRVEPRVEQLIRAEKLQEAGLMDMIHPDDLTPELMRAKVEDMMESSLPEARKQARSLVDLSGADRAVALVEDRLEERARLVAHA